MKIAVIIAIVIFLVFAILFFVPFFLVIEFSKKEQVKGFNVRIKYLFFNIELKNKTNKKRNKKLKRKPPQIEDKKITENIKKGIEIFKYLEDDIVTVLDYASEKALIIRKIIFFADFGLGNPMNTGISTGAMYGVIYNILSLLNNIFTVEECDIKINPDFEKKHLDVYSECILKIKSVHIILIVFKVLKMYFKIKKI